MLQKVRCPAGRFSSHLLFQIQKRPASRGISSGPGRFYNLVFLPGTIGKYGAFTAAVQPCLLSRRFGTGDQPWDISRLCGAPETKSISENRDMAGVCSILLIGNLQHFTHRKSDILCEIDIFTGPHSSWPRAGHTCHSPLRTHSPAPAPLPGGRSRLQRPSSKWPLPFHNRYGATER